MHQPTLCQCTHETIPAMILPIPKPELDSLLNVFPYP
jgi:hypothetical protein